ncbi:MAG: metal-dependent hydrolase [Chromatiales bacterium]|nr:metal-dependent hydrolase [Chromatiales bacterium]
MTPLGHGAVGYLLGEKRSRPIALALLVGAVLPDVDFAFLAMDGFNELHRGVTHSLGFAVIAALAAGIAVHNRGAGFAVGLGVLSHLLIDSALDSNPSNGIGVAWLWPITDTVWSPFNLLSAEQNNPGWADPLTMMKHAAPALLYEIPLWLLATALWVRRRQRGIRQYDQRADGQTIRRSI